jgi:hypothetical protein
MKKFMGKAEETKSPKGINTSSNTTIFGSIGLVAAVAVAVTFPVLLGVAPMVYGIVAGVIAGLSPILGFAADKYRDNKIENTAQESAAKIHDAVLNGTDQRILDQIANTKKPSLDAGGQTQTASPSQARAQTVREERNNQAKAGRGNS